VSQVHYRTYDDWLRDLVHPSKDVEALGQNWNARWHFRARARERSLGLGQIAEVWIPCTALSVYRILHTYHQFHDTFDQQAETNSVINADASILPAPQYKGRWSGVTVSIINRSEIFGRPLAALLALDGATVYSIDESSILIFWERGRMRRCTPDITIDSCLQQSSVVVTGVPFPEFRLPCSSIGIIDDHRSKSITVIDISEYGNVTAEALREANLSKAVNFVPHVGKVTVASLEHNLIRLHQRSRQQGNVSSLASQ
jgi:methylenetetrahydrofolate dehydrogenase (NAD+)